MDAVRTGPGFITSKPSLELGGAKNQGTAIGSSDIKEFSSNQQRYELEMLQKINRRHAAEREFEGELVGRIPASRGSV